MIVNKLMSDCVDDRNDSNSDDDEDDDRKNDMSFDLRIDLKELNLSMSLSSKLNLTTSATKRQVTHWTELMELLAEYLSQNKCLNESIILMITRIAMSALLLNSCELQAVAVRLLCHVFKQYAKHRNSILEELLNSFHRISVKSGKSSSEKNQNVFTRLLIALTNALFD